MMNRSRSCKRCNYALNDMDPHTICKSCRQPDPQMFFCSEQDCEACIFIKENKPLDAFLRKQELANLQRKLQQFATHHSNSERPVYTNKSLELFSNNSRRSNTNVATDIENKMTQYDTDIIKSVVKSMYRGENGGPSTMKADNSSSSASTSNKNDNLRELEKRLFDRVMSSVMSSISDSKESSLEPKELNNSAPKVKPTQAPSSANINSTFIELDKDDCELNHIMVTFLEEFFPDSFSRVNKGSNENGRSEFVVKISSRTCDILSKGTILSAPSQASKLRGELKMESGMLHWPLKLSAADILYSNMSKLPSMKPHPKIRHMHSILFGKLNPTLPANLLGENFALPELSIELKNEFFFAREQLQRLLLIFSIMDYFSGEKIVQENESLFAFFDVVMNYLKTCMEKQANFVGLLIQELRRDLLRDADCKIPDAVPKLITGSIHQTHFFGPYVKELQDIVENSGRMYCLTSKSDDASVSLFKLPPKFKEGDAVEKFLVSLRVFFEANSTSDKDKVSILESLLPSVITDRLSKFVKPNKICETGFEELSSMLKRFDCNNSSDILIDRSMFTKTMQTKYQSVQEFADQLENVLPKCMYGASARELLRDQFVFGLFNKVTQQFLFSKFTWSFEECVEYAEEEEEKSVSDESSIAEDETKSVEAKSPTKRKKEEKVEVDHISKKQKIKEDIEPVQKKQKDQEIIKEPYFYDYSNPKNKIVSVKSVQQWNDLFGFEVKHTYEVFCPWTGQVLRS